MNSLDDRVLLHLVDGRRVPVDPHEIYCLSVDDGNTLVRTRRAVGLIDVRQLSEIMEHFENHGFVQVHRSWAVNLRKIREIGPPRDRGWEIRLDPPVNLVLPVSRRRVGDVWALFGE